MPIHKLRALEYLVAVVDHGSFAAAGRRLGLAAPSVHRLVCALEEELGVQLLDRESTPIRPLPDAEGYVAKARLLVEEHRALDESLQVEINRLLVTHFDAYEDLHGVRTRRSGGQVYVEVFLEFDGRKSMADVQRSIDLLTADLERNIPSSHIVICPRTSRVI